MGASVGGTVRHLVSGHDGVVVSSAAAPDWPALRAAVWGRVMAPRQALLQPTTWEPDYAPTLPATLVVPTTHAGPDGSVVWVAPAAYTVACGASPGNVITACCAAAAACHGGNYTVLVDGAPWRVDTGPAATVLAAIPALSARCGDDWVGVSHWGRASWGTYPLVGTTSAACAAKPAHIDKYVADLNAIKRSALSAHLMPDVSIMAYDHDTVMPRSFDRGPSDMCVSMNVTTAGAVVRPEDRGSPGPYASYGFNGWPAIASATRQVRTHIAEDPRYLDPGSTYGVGPGQLEAWCSDVGCASTSDMVQAVCVTAAGRCVPRQVPECGTQTNETCTGTGFTPCVWISAVAGRPVNSVQVGLKGRAVIGSVGRAVGMCVSVLRKTVMDDDNYVDLFARASELIYKPGCAARGDCRRPDGLLGYPGANTVNQVTNIATQSLWFAATSPVSFFQAAPALASVSMVLNASAVPYVDRSDPTVFYNAHTAGLVAANVTSTDGSSRLYADVPGTLYVVAAAANGPNCGPGERCRVLIDDLTYCTCQAHDAGTWRGACTKPTTQFYTPATMAPGQWYYPHLLKTAYLPDYQSCPHFEGGALEIDRLDAPQWPAGALAGPIQIASDSIQLLHYCDRYRGEFVFCDNDAQTDADRAAMCHDYNGSVVTFGLAVTRLTDRVVCDGNVCFIFPGPGPFGSVAAAMAALDNYAGYTFHIAPFGMAVLEQLLLEPVSFETILTLDYSMPVAGIPRFEAEQALAGGLGDAFCGRLSNKTAAMLAAIADIDRMVTRNTDEGVVTFPGLQPGPQVGLKSFHVHLPLAVARPAIRDVAVVTRSLTVMGHGATFASAGPVCRHFTVNAAGVTIRDVHFDQTACTGAGEPATPIVFNVRAENATIINVRLSGRPAAGGG